MEPATCRVLVPTCMHGALGSQVCDACYACCVRSISHRELRNNSGQILESVRNGETVAVTNHGELAAVLVPPHTALIDQLDASGRVRHPTNDSPLGPSERIHHALATSVALEDLRGDR